ncbi:MAG: type III secretion system outer membrane ring subunit SctC [Candidatus Thiodiazotropha taylori]|nr:type III secretion system outer membrane ring subunit SctC [Candidatus Thiodiazotropha taylori]MCG8051021.1 type III secretion system outer membrane ring subunit SctC [Candidatus Thiodiazotropha taylori]MCW4312840.1 type III secretion system outer membrane ring subunit SctC [Candidatus Thiodiazotropha taylori]MCW4320754.1 type III secretion system outer membrane ring subunit SctC [Candidatus Thiodiazotropha taylori]
MKLFNRNWKSYIAIICLIILYGNSQAAETPNLSQNITIIAREQPIDSFLKELFGQLSIPVVIDESVKGTVNGSFENITANEIFSDISKSFGLIKYYDGAILYIYTSNNIIRRIIPASSSISKRIVRAANDLNLTDRRNSIRKAVEGGLVVTGTKRFIEQVDELVFAAENGLKNYEAPVGFKVFYLKYAWAQDVSMTFAGKQVVIPGVATILRQLIQESPHFIYSAQSQDNLVKPTTPGLKGQGLNSIGNTDRIGIPDRGDLVQTNSHSDQYIHHVASNSQIIEQSSKVRIQADPRLNAIIIRDSPDRMSRYKSLIDSLDVEPQMLEIEATIIDINTGKLKELGINWRWQNNDDEVLFGSGEENSDRQLSTRGTITPFGRGGFISFVLGDNAKFIGRINALESKGAAHIVSRPHVITLSNVEAIFDTSSTFYVRVAGREEVDLYNVSVGTSLRVTPHVFKDNGEAKIKLLVTIEDGQQTEQKVDDIPVVSRSAINTQALINAGESVLIGGLVREVKKDTEDKIPLLGDIPIMGNLFKTTNKQTTRVERLFLISPKLAVQKLQTNEKLSRLINEDFNTEERTQPQNKSSASSSESSQVKESWQMILDI